MTAAEQLLRIVRDAKGDDLERAEMAFANRPDLLDHEYGQSGQTRRQILEGYRRGRAEWRGALELLGRLLGGTGGERK